MIWAEGSPVCPMPVMSIRLKTSSWISIQERACALSCIRAANTRFGKTHARAFKVREKFSAPGQVMDLAIPAKLFIRSGRKIELTDAATSRVSREIESFFEGRSTAPKKRGHAGSLN